MALFLAAITARLLSRILGAPDAPLRAIMPERGEAGNGAMAGGSDRFTGAGPDTTIVLASASVTPRRFASSVNDRVGASPSPRSATCKMPNRA